MAAPTTRAASGLSPSHPRSPGFRFARAPIENGSPPGAPTTHDIGYRLWRVAEPDIPAGGGGARVTIEEAALEAYPSGSALAQAFGSAILEPSWFPADAGEVS